MIWPNELAAALVAVTCAETDMARGLLTIAGLLGWFVPVVALACLVGWCVTKTRGPL